MYCIFVLVMLLLEAYIYRSSRRSSLVNRLKLLLLASDRGVCSYVVAAKLWNYYVSLLSSSYNKTKGKFLLYNLLKIVMYCQSRGILPCLSFTIWLSCLWWCRSAKNFTLCTYLRESTLQCRKTWNFLLCRCLNSMTMSRYVVSVHLFVSCVITYVLLLKTLTDCHLWL